jgi:hypothetical protein
MTGRVPPLRHNGRILLIAWLCLGAGSLNAQSPLRFGVPAETLLASNCVAQPGNVPVPMPPGERNVEIVEWSAAPAAGPHFGEFVLRFKSPVPVGAVVGYELGDLQFWESNRWVTLPADAESGRKLQVRALPPALRIEGIKCTVPARPVPGNPAAAARYQATLPFLALLPIRVQNIAPGAVVSASSTNPAARPPQWLVQGEILPGRNFSTASRTTPRRPDASDWLMLEWQESRSFRGLALFWGKGDEGLGPVQVEAFQGPGDPRAAEGTNVWRDVQTKSTAPGRFREHQFVVASAPVETRALRLVNTNGISQMQLGQIVVLAPLGTNPAPTLAGAPRKSMTILKVATGRIRVDGKDDDWPAGRENGFALARDEERLYVLYQAAPAEAAFANRGTNLQELFQSGDAVDLQLQTRPQANPDRDEPAPGDVRLVFSIFEGKPVTVLYEYRTEDLLVLPVRFQSASGTTSCDKVGLCKGAEVEIRLHPGGLTVEASVPLAVLGGSGAAKIPAVTRGDFGRIFAAPVGGAGRQSYWSNPATNLPADLAQGAAIHPRTWGELR